MPGNAAATLTPEEGERLCFSIATCVCKVFCMRHILSSCIGIEDVASYNFFWTAG